MTKFYNKLSKIIFFSLFFFLLTQSKQVFAEPLVGEKLEKFLFENTITYEDGGGYKIKLNFYDNQTFSFEVLNFGIYRGNWNFVNSKKGIYLPLSITPMQQYQLGADVPQGIIEFDNKFIIFKGTDGWRRSDKLEYSSFNRLIEQQRQAEIKRKAEIQQIEIKKQAEIKKEQDRIRVEQLKIKQEEEKRRLEEEKEIIRKKEAEEEAKLKREKFWKDTFFFIIVSASIVGSYYYINRFHKEKIIIYKNRTITKLKNIWSSKWGKVLVIFFGLLILSNLFSKSESVDSTGKLLEGLGRPVPNSQGLLFTCVYETEDGKRFSKDFPNKFMNPCPRYYNLKTGEFSSY
jgi:hypothetical protein